MHIKKPPGLIKRGKIYHIDARIGGRRVCETCQTTELDVAVLLLAKRRNEAREREQFGVRPVRTFAECTHRYAIENHNVKKSIEGDYSLINGLLPYIGHLPISAVNDDALVPFISDMRLKGRAPATINNYKKIVRRVVRLAANVWRDEGGLTWLESAPKFTMLVDNNKRPPHPITIKEQNDLFEELPSHLLPMAKFAVSTGCRDREICNLQWAWEVPVSSFNTFVFRIPAEYVKNGEPRFIILNDDARRVVDEQRGKHPEYVFLYRDHPMKRMNNSAWRSARTRAGLLTVRVHDMRHTFATRLRALGVSHEDRATLLGHKTGSITTHYSAPDFRRLLDGVNKLCDPSLSDAEPIVLR
jgi:integrase